MEDNHVYNESFSLDGDHLSCDPDYFVSAGPLPVPDQTPAHRLFVPLRDLRADQDLLQHRGDRTVHQCVRPGEISAGELPASAALLPADLFPVLSVLQQKRAAQGGSERFHVYVYGGGRPLRHPSPQQQRQLFLPGGLPVFPLPRHAHRLCHPPDPHRVGHLFPPESED